MSQDDKCKYLMKVIALLSVAIVVCFVIFGAGCVIPGSDYTVGYAPGDYPISYTNMTSGNAEGFGVDSLQWAADDQHLSLRFVSVDPADAAAELANGTISMYVSGLPKNYIQEFGGEISIPFINGYNCLIMKKGTSCKPEDVLSGNGSIAYVADREDSLAQYLKLVLGTDLFNSMDSAGKIIYCPTSAAAAQSVVLGKADACIIRTSQVTDTLNDYPFLFFAGFLKDDPIELSVVVREGDSELLSKIDTGLSRLQNSSDRKELMDTYHIPYMKDSYVVGIDIDHAPFSYLDANGNNTGFDIDSMRWIADTFGFNVTFKDVSWIDNIRMVQSGELDLWFAGMTITEERERRVAFSDPYYSADIGVGMLNTSTYTAADFESGKLRAAAVSGTSTFKWLVSFFGDTGSAMEEAGTLSTYKTQAALIDALYQNEIDVAVFNDAVLRSEASKSSLKILSVYETGEEYGVAINNGDIVLQTVINEGLKRLESSGMRDELLKKYSLS